MSFADKGIKQSGRTKDGKEVLRCKRDKIDGYSQCPYNSGGL